MVIRKLSIGVIALGFLLHTYTYIFKSQGEFDIDTFGLLLMASMPYIVCSIILMIKDSFVMPLSG